MADTLGQINPIRYRSYYYDNETGFYYLNSRYYDPEIKRFINADGQLNKNQSLFGGNLFAYCYNNPVNMVDFDGNVPEYFLFRTTGGVLEEFAKFLSKEAAKSILSIAGFAVLKAMDMPLSNIMYQHGIYGKGTDLSSETYALMEKKIKSSLDYYYKIEEITDKYRNAGSFASSDKLTINFSSGDVYYAIHSASIFVRGTKIRDSYGVGWDLTVTVYDIYDFTEYKTDKSFGAKVNNLGYEMQNLGLIQTYNWSITFKQIWRH